MTFSFYKKISLIIVFVSCAYPHVTDASSLYIETSKKDFFVGDKIVLDVRIDSENKHINTVTGDVVFHSLPNNISIGEISLAHSSFSLWPRKPSLVDSKKISFEGGIPGGMQSKDGVLFKIVMDLKEVGDVNIGFENIGVYLHDGKGTLDVHKVHNLTFSVLPAPPNYVPTDEWDAFIDSDKTSPEKFSIYVGQDTSVFDGKKFLSFYTVDRQSEVRYYEVKEGNLPVVRSGSTYVLQDQHNNNRVIVTAYDAMGNSQTSVYNPKKASLLYLIPFGIVILILLYKKIWLVKK